MGVAFMAGKSRCSWAGAAAEIQEAAQMAVAQQEFEDMAE
jgi:hypothetical protein